MKAISIILVLSFSACFGQEQDLFKGKPKTLEDTFVFLDQKFNDTATYNLMVLPEDVVVSRLQFPFGMWIRNNWGLWKKSDLKSFFEKEGIYHPEAMTTIIFTSYYRYLHNDSIDLKGQIERLNRINSNKEKRTTTAELFEYYPVGDSVLVTLSGEKGLFKKSVTFKGVGKINGYTENKLQLTLIELIKSDKIKAEYTIGEEVDAWADSCTLIPPKNWRK
jgi:hypothetical protein